MTLEQQLAEGLIVAANANMALTTPSDAVMRQAMENLAHPIAEAIKNGTATLTESSVSQLNAGADDDRLYITSDAGALVNGDRSTTNVTAGSVVFRRGGKWYVLGVGGGGGGGDDPEIDCYTKAETDALIAQHNTSPNAHADIREALNAEAQERDDADSREIRARQNADRQIREDKADKVSNATNGHLAGLDANGNLTDSGIGASDIANKVFIAIEYATPFNDILAAYNAGKVILLANQDGSRYYYLMNYLAPYGTALARFTFYYKDLDFHDSFDRRRDTYTYVESNDEWHNVTLESAKKSHASTDTSFGEGSENSYGHVQLTGSVTQNSSKAVKSGAVYDALQVIRGDIANKQNTLASNSLAFIYKPTNGDATKFLNEQGNFVSVDGIPVQKIVIGQTLQRRIDCLYSYGSVNELYVMTGWVERRQSGAAYEMILRSINTETPVYIKVLITEQNVVYTVSGINGFLYNKWNLEDSINTDVVLVTYKEGVINPSFDALINAVHNRRDVLLAVYLENEAQEYYRLQWWKLYSSDNVYDFHFALYDESAHRFKSYRFSYNTGGSLINAVGEVFSPISSVGTNNIVDGAVTNAKLTNNSVYGDKISNSAITRLKIADGAVWTDKLVDNAVTSPKIADGAINARHKYTALCEWTRDSQYSSSSLKVTICGGPSSGNSSTTSTNKLSFILLNYGESMIFVNNTYNGTTEIYCEVEQLPKFSWLHFIICATNTTSSHKVSIVFRTNSSTTLGYYIKGRVSGSNSNYTYTLDAGECADFYLLRGEDTNGKCTLFLQRTWVADG